MRLKLCRPIRSIPAALAGHTTPYVSHAAYRHSSTLRAVGLQRACLQVSPICFFYRPHQPERDCAGISGAGAVRALADSAQATTAPAEAPCLQDGLYVVATPIGNLEDLSFRALRVLKQASLVLAEDTRHTQKLFNHYQIKNRLVSLHSHNEAGRVQQVLSLLKDGGAVAMVSDAGMPAISDAGSILVAAAIHAGHDVTPVPGPSASLAALVASGLPTAEFHFVGFLPAKAAGRQARLREVKDLQATLIFFVPARSIAEVLTDMATAFGAERQCTVARELTKVHEEFHRGSLQSLATTFTEDPVRGEITLVVHGNAGSDGQDDAQLQIRREYVEDLIMAGLAPSTASKIVSKHFDCAKKPLYEYAKSLSKSMLEDRVT